MPFSLDNLPSSQSVYQPLELENEGLTELQSSATPSHRAIVPSSCAIDHHPNPSRTHIHQAQEAPKKPRKSRRVLKTAGPLAPAPPSNSKFHTAMQPIVVHRLASSIILTHVSRAAASHYFLKLLIRHFPTSLSSDARAPTVYYHKLPYSSHLLQKRAQQIEFTKAQAHGFNI